jgi:putative ATPase
VPGTLKRLLWNSFILYCRAADSISGGSVGGRGISTGPSIDRIMHRMESSNSGKGLFEAQERANLQSGAPLAARMRPRTIDEFVGQKHFLGPGKLLTRMLQADRLTSLIFHGPPGVGKTSLAMVIARQTRAKFHYLSAPAATVKDIRDVIAEARDRLASQKARTVLFVDEIHRFNRAQQDVLLNDVESGVLILIGATSENPYFSINGPLISRSTVFLGKLKVQADAAALEFLADRAEGDARKVLTALEVGVLSQPKDGPPIFNLETARESIQQKAIAYDGTGDTHYDLASALQKSMRGSDPDATVYWLARMLAGGEDPRFIARRIAICATEDVGNADPMAAVLAAAALQIAEFVGLPEAQLALAQAAIYVACAPKSNASAGAIWQATSDVQTQPIRPVPKHLKDSHYSAAKKAGIGADYRYPHDYPGGYVPQEYLPGPPKRYYAPKDIGYEKNIQHYLQTLRTLVEHGETLGKGNSREDSGSADGEG